MRIRGFNFVGEFDTKSTADKDLVHTIYCMDNNALAAIIQDRRKKMGNKFYIVYGYNPRFGTYLAKWGEWDEYSVCRLALEHRFADQHPDILVNNHRADYISRIYGTCWEEVELVRRGDTMATVYTHHLFNHTGRYTCYPDESWTSRVHHNPTIDEATAEFDRVMADFREEVAAAPNKHSFDRLKGAVEPTPWRF